MKCVICDGVLCKWEWGNVPHEEHKKYFPNCPFVKGCNGGNVATFKDDMCKITRGIKRRDLGISLNQPSPSKKRKDASHNVAETEEDNYTCSICMDRPKTVLFLPCKHFKCCMECAAKCDRCPICMRNVMDRLKIYP